MATLSSGNLQAFRPPVSSAFVPRRATENRDDLRHLSSLAEIGRALGGAQELRSSLERALEKLEAGMGIVRGAVFLFGDSISAESGELQVAAALGLTKDGLRARYQAGEGIIGRVVESGGKELALELESKGYAGFDEAAA